MAVHRYVVTVRTEKSGGGTFKPADEIGEQLLESIEGADPGSIDVDNVTYETTEWEVEEIDLKGQVVPWSDEAEARSKARSEERRKENEKRQAESSKKYEAYRAEKERLRKEKPHGRVYIHTSLEGDTELDLDQYDRIAFEVPNPNSPEKGSPAVIHVSREIHDPDRIEIKTDGIGRMLVLPRDSTCVQIKVTKEW